MAAPARHANEVPGLPGTMTGPSRPYAEETQLPPFKGRVRTTCQESAGDGFKAQDGTYAVSPCSPLLVTRLKDNLYIWGGAAGTLGSAQPQAAFGPGSDPCTHRSQPPAPCSNALLHNQSPEQLGKEAVTACTATAGASGASFSSSPAAARTTCLSGACGGGPAGRFAALSLGDGHAAAVTVRGEVLTWGCNYRGQCGHSVSTSDHQDGGPTGRPDGSAAAVAACVPPLPVRFPLAGDRCRNPVQVRSVACGGEHTLAVTTAGVYAWGCNAFGQCGLGDGAPGTVPLPAAVPGLRGVPVCQLAAGRTHSLALTAASQVMSWGDGASGQLGLGDRRPRRAPVAVEALWALPVVQIAAGEAHSAAVTCSGHVFAWGCNYWGQLGLLPERGRQQRAGGPGVGPPGPPRGERQEVVPGSPGASAAAEAGDRADPNPSLTAAAAKSQAGTPVTPPGWTRRAAAVRRNGGAGRPNSQWLLAMVEMGIPARHARIALQETGNAGVEVATEWLFAVDRSGLPAEEEAQAAAASPLAAAASPLAAAAAAASAAAPPPPPDSPCPAPTATADVTAAAAVLPEPESRHDPHVGAGSAGRHHTGRDSSVNSDSNGGGGGGAPGGASVPAERASSSGRNGGRGGGGGGGGGPDGSAASSPGAGAASEQGDQEGCYGSPGEYGSPDEYGSPGGVWDDLVVPEPRRVPLKDVRFLAAGPRHTVAVTDSGVFAWGDGATGALGLGDCESRDLPCRLSAFQPHDDAAATPPADRPPPEDTAAVAVEVASTSHRYMASRLSGGGLGLGPDTVTTAAAVELRPASPPVGIQMRIQIQRVACGAQHTLFLAQDGSVYWCGTMPYGLAATAAGGGGSSTVASDDALTGPELLEVPQSARGVGAADGGGGGGGSDGGRVAFSATPRRLDAGSPRLPLSAAAGSAAGPVVYDIAARGACSAVLMCSPRELPQVPSPACGTHLLVKLRSAIRAAAEARGTWAQAREGAAGCGGGIGMDLARLSASFKAVTTGVQTVLGSPAAISAAFGRRSGMGLDCGAFEGVLTGIRQLLGGAGGGPSGGGGESLAGTVVELHRFSCLAALQSAASQLVEDLAAHVRMLGTPERAQVLLAALQHPLMSDPRVARQLLPRLAVTVMAAPSLVRTWLVRWWAEYPGPLLESRVVAPLQALLTRELGATKKLTTPLMALIKVLALVHEAAGLSNSLPPEAFYNALISDKLDVQDHYSAWRQAQELASSRQPPRETPFSFCSYPFLLNARAKSHLLHLEARFQMEQSVAHARMEVQLYGQGLAEQRRAAEGLVLTKTARDGSSSSGCSTSNKGSSSSSGADRGGSNRSSSRGAGDAATSSSRGCGGGGGVPAWSRCVGVDSSGGSSSGGGVANIVGESLRSLFSLLRRRNQSGPGSSGADDRGGRDQGPKAQERCGPLELPRPSECPMPGVHSDMCLVRVRRTHLVEDAMEELGRQARRDLLKPLRVHFIGEEGIDAGGVKKEFFALLVERLLSPDYGMMSYDEASRTYWFNPASLEPPSSYFLLGLVLGLAVYNRVLLDFPAPLLLYTRLRGGREPGLRDLEGWQPELARGLRQLLEYDGPEPVSEVFGLTFSVDVDRFGRVETVPLKPGGEFIPVTEDNRSEYVALLAAWHTGGSVAAQWEAFAAGFRVLCRGPAMSLFNDQELERLVCGNPRLDFAALRDSARYEGGYSRDSPVVGWLWDIVLNELVAEDQRAFLKFFTGSDRSPLGGLGSLRPVIQRDGPGSHKLPTAHTCFNTLLLPEYGSRAKLGALLRLAINNSEGFGLQ